jgi:hypothetical protein
MIAFHVLWWTLLMPWDDTDAPRFTKKATSDKSKRQWAHIADSVLSKGGSEKSAIMQASGVIKKGRSKSSRPKLRGKTR